MSRVWSIAAEGGAVMGCDIHIQIEVQTADGWRLVPFVTDLPDHCRDLQESWRHERRQSRDAAVAAGATLMPDHFDGRNYDLFGIIGDVRNGHGFGGVVTGEAWPSIAPHRGLPSDVVKDGFDEDGPHWINGQPTHLGDHSFTWISLDELKAFDWDGTFSNQRGLVMLAVWKTWREQGGIRPASWCGGISGQVIQIISQPQAEVWTGDVTDRIYVESFWQENGRLATDDWPGQILPKLDEIAAGRPLRLIVGFDS